MRKVARPFRRAAGEHHDIAAPERFAHAFFERVHVVREHAEAHRLAAGFGDRGGENRGVRVIDAAGLELLPGRDQLVAGRKHRHFRPPHRRRSRRARRPHSMPISREPSTEPRRNSVSPRAMSEPANEMNWPGAAARRTSIAGPVFASISSVCSIITTASAPRGTMPPVAIVVAVPGATASFGATPHASTSSLSMRRRGFASLAPAISAARTAKPSTLERSNGGTSIGGFDVGSEHAPEHDLQARRARPGEA